jgi:8-hydroxy-5-deazaflavin:NADPH oxidoreductase
LAFSWFEPKIYADNKYTTNMNIAIIGTGNVGGALAQQLVKAKHSVLMGAKFPLSEKSMLLAQKIGEDRFTNLKNAVKQSEVVIITTPPEAVIPMISELGDLTGKTLVDATNSIRTKAGNYPTAYHALKDLTKMEGIVKCFNSTGFENMLNPNFQGSGIDMFCAGDNQEAKKIAKRLSLDIGFANCYDFGGDDKVELLEKLAMCWINLAIIQGHGRNLAFKLLKNTTR